MFNNQNIREKSPSSNVHAGIKKIISRKKTKLSVQKKKETAHILFIQKKIAHIHFRSENFNVPTYL